MYNLFNLYISFVLEKVYAVCYNWKKKWERNYTVPYRSLIPVGVDNMLVAGKCISPDHGAQASYRIMPTVSAIGEAAGTAIGVAVNSNIKVRGIDVTRLRETLRKNGAFIKI